MAKSIIAIDIDDVLANSTEALRLEVNTRLGVSIPASDYHLPGEYSNYYETVWLKHRIDDQISMDELDPHMKADQSHISPHPGAVEALRQLAEGYELIVITGRSLDWQEATEAWLDRYFPDVFASVIFGGGFEEIKQKSKGELCVEHGAEWLIDDNVEHARSARAKGVKVVLFGEYGWQHRAPKDMVRCRDWAAVQGYFTNRY